MAENDSLMDGVLAQLISEISQQEPKGDQEKPPFVNILEMFDAPFTQDTLNVISQQMFGVVPDWLAVGSPSTIRSALGSVDPQNPDQIRIEQGLLNAVALGVLKGFPNPVDRGRTVAAHELAHVGQGVGVNPVSQGERSLGTEVQAHVFSSLIRSLSDLASAKPKQVEIGNVMNRAESYLLRSLQSDPRFQELKELPTEKTRTPMVKLLKDIIALNFFSGHPVNQKSETR